MLTSSLHITASHPSHPSAVSLLDGLSSALARITGSSGRDSFDPADVVVPGALFVIARDQSGVPLGCGAYRPLGEGIAELKRMFAVAEGWGVGSAVLAFLEQQAVNDGYRELWLETREINELAVAFYARRGYRRIPNFGKYVGRTEAVCFGKMLD